MSRVVPRSPQLKSKGAVAVCLSGLFVTPLHAATVPAREGVALTPLKGNSANSVCGTFNAGALRASQGCRGAEAWSREQGEGSDGGEGLGRPSQG